MTQRIPVTVVTGFLGAGKTSLLRHMVEQANGRRLAFVINEFGDVGVDRETLLGCELPGCAADLVRELANGCVCCTVADDFLPTMAALVDLDPAPDHIVIETSGLALPKPLLQAFRWPGIAGRATVDGVITVLDTPAVAAGRFADDPDAVARQRDADGAIDHDNPLAEVFDDQLACADLVLLNKADLADEAAVAVARETIAARLRPGVKLLETVAGRAPLAVLLGLDAGAENDLAVRPSIHDGADAHDHDDFASVVVELETVGDLDRLVERVRSVTADPDILRVKGFVATDASPRRCVIQAVGGRVERWFDRPWRQDEQRRSALVVIGRHGFDEGAVRAGLGVA
jgi:cobalamin biosynthesis protein CobW